jgi:hypothetical protein
MEGILEVRFKHPIDFLSQPYNQNPEHWVKVNVIRVEGENGNVWDLAACINNVKVENDTADPCLARFFLYFNPLNGQEFPHLYRWWDELPSFYFPLRNKRKYDRII